MEDAERFHLLGTYRTPCFRYGRKVLCEVRGEVTIVGLTDAPIPWPFGRRGRGRDLLVVYKGLAKAIRRESEQAICRWWGVCPTTVWKWRKALGVGIVTEGTSRLHSEYTKEPWAVEAIRQIWLGSHHSEETRHRMSEAHRKRGTLVPGTIPWTAEEDNLVKTLPVEEAAKKTGRSLSAVYARRWRLGMPDGRRRRVEERPPC
jgi:hypothetical protein